jgi:hypothetical protein
MHSTLSHLFKITKNSAVSAVESYFAPIFWFQKIFGSLVQYLGHRQVASKAAGRETAKGPKELSLCASTRFYGTAYMYSDPVKSRRRGKKKISFLKSETVEKKKTAKEVTKINREIGLKTLKELEEAGKKAYTVINSKGEYFFLHSKEATLPSGNYVITYFFSTQPQGEVVDVLPTGYSVKVTISGLPILVPEK